MPDLFDKRTDKEKLLDFMRDKKWAKTSEILAWGLQNYSNRADRNARQLAQDGHLRRMSDDEKLFRFGKIAEDIWIYIARR